MFFAKQRTNVVAVSTVSLTLPKMPSTVEIPLLYRILFLYIEPLGAFFGVFVNLLTPVTYLRSLSPQATATTYSPLDQPIYDQLAAHLLFFAWAQAIVLRSTSDIYVWKTLLFGMALCDVLHLWASYGILGPEVFFNPAKWRWEEWVNFVMLYGPGGLRLAFCAECGFGKQQKAE